MAVLTTKFVLPYIRNFIPMEPSMRYNVCNINRNSVAYKNFIFTFMD